MTRPAQITFRSVSKRFPGVVALEGVSFQVAAGSCHALLGENGAGKSTLGRILAGIFRPDAGWIELGGQRQSFHSPVEAQRAGIGIVHQELSLCPNLSVAENVCLSALPNWGGRVRWGELGERAGRFLRQVGARFELHEALERLTAGQRQLVQIAAALATGARILVMDEPTSSLSAAEARRLEDLLARLRAGGTTILYVSHRLEEIFRLCDTVTVLRDGRHVATLPLAQTNEAELVRMMIGRPLEKRLPAQAAVGPGPELLRVEGLSSPGRYDKVSFGLRAGEVVGVAGLVGAGRTEMALGIFGLDRAMTGRVLVEGKPVRIGGPQQAMSLGIGLVGEERKQTGLVPEMSCGQNATLSALDCPAGRGFWRRLMGCPGCSLTAECLRPWGVIRLGAERRRIADLFGQLRVRAASPDVPAVTLSGGNQQKLLLARCLARRCRILLLDEPTRGVDVGAKAEIHRLINDLAAAGSAILMISSELPELLQMSTRLLVMRRGQLVGQLARAEATEEKVMQLMAGQSGAATGPEGSAFNN